MNEENKILEENIKRHISVMLEDVKSDFKVFGEKLTDVDRKVDGIAEDLKIVKQDVEYLKEDMDYVKSEIVEIKDRFKETDGVSENHEKRITKLENTVLAKA